MAPMWEQIRGTNYSTMGRAVSGVVHYSNGSRQAVFHTPTDTWRYENDSGEPTFIENPENRWSRAEDGVMIHAVKSPHTMYAVMGSTPSLLLRAYHAFPPPTGHGLDQQRFVDPVVTGQVTVRGRTGWEVTGRDQHSGEAIAYVFDAELGVALRWQHGDDWMELENPVLDEVFADDLFTWTGPSRPEADEMAKHYREHEEKQRALAAIPQAVPTWLPTEIVASPMSGDPRTSELSLSIHGQTPHFTLRRWLNAIGEPTLEFPNDGTPERYRQEVGDWTYEIRSYQEIDQADCVRIVESIIPVDPPDRDPADITAEIETEESDRREAEVREALGTGRILADYLDHESLFIRTDFTEDTAWRDIAVAAMAEDAEFPAYLTCIDNREYDGLTVAGLLGIIGEPPPYYVFLVDAETVRNPESPIAAVYTGPDDPDRPRGRFFRIVPSEIAGAANNWSIANMDFEDFADSADEDGVFRGFPEPARPVEEVTTREIAQWIEGDLTTDALRALHAEFDGRKYPYPVQLFAADLSEVHAETLGVNGSKFPGSRFLGYDDFLAATSRGGTALRGSVPGHQENWIFLLDSDSHRPIAAYRVTYQPYTPPAGEEPRTKTVEVPFVNREHVSLASLTDDDDLIARDIVQRAIVAEAARLHPDATIIGGEPVLARIPRLEGFNIGAHVKIDDELVFFVAIVTDVDDEFIVLEVPREGMRIVGPGES
ncbi:DUF6924 domain-containing protein [Rhodococcus sp. P1Y]|uniref:DUF6924 domain-containing protein n=1 Tax=Rhodococcus sp. P1Y TaxID=1302308 RepID=UPI000EB573AB|nr:hypothetical protein [Rhodococcus sp. P1Y]AYJ48024.1 hypothetical protein D8W71_06395 [Rhodococcus sp. P1Y]